MIYAYGFAVVMILVGLGFFAADVPVTRMCRRDCWLTELLNMIFGDRITKIFLGSIFLLLATSCIRLARKIGRGVKK